MTSVDIENQTTSLLISSSLRMQCMNFVNKIVVEKCKNFRVESYSLQMKKDINY